MNRKMGLAVLLTLITSQLAEAGGEASKATEGSISGRFTVRDSAKNLEFTLDCLGKNQEGKLESPGGGFKIGGPTNSVTSTTWAPRTSTISWDNEAGIGQHQHVNRPAGHYLVSLRGNRQKDRNDGIRYEGYYDFKWVELTDADPKVTVDLVIDRSKLGSLEVSLPKGSNQWIVVYLPLDPDGKLPLPDAVSYMQAGSSVEVQGDKAVIRDFREGKYLIASATNTSKNPANNPDRTKITAQSVVDVRRGKTPTKATLAPSAVGAAQKHAESGVDGRADLAVGRVYLENGYLRATVKNSGKAAAVKFKVTFFVDGELTSNYIAAVLRPGKELAASASKLPPGTHTVKVVVNADDVVPETDETNNSKEETLSAPG